MSAADNHKQRSRRGYIKQHRTLAPKNTPRIALGKVRQKRKAHPISSLFFRRPASG